MKIEEVFETENSIYIIIELLGVPLYEIIKLINSEKTRNVMKNILGRLAEMHAKGLMHRDLKLENILINPKTGKFLIADFGLAEYYQK